MKSLLLIVAILVAVAVPSFATPYIRYIGENGAPVWKSAGFDVSPRTPLNTVGVVNVGLLTHSTADGSLCAKLNLGSWCVPESWVPLQASLGGSFADQLYGGLGTGFNLAPQVGALLFAKVRASSSASLQALKTAFAAQDPTKTQVRLGVDFIGSIAQDGRFVSLREGFPGRGPMRVLGNAARLNIGLAW